MERENMTIKCITYEHHLGRPFFLQFILQIKKLLAISMPLSLQKIKRGTKDATFCYVPNI